MVATWFAACSDDYADVIETPGSADITDTIDSDTISRPSTIMRIIYSINGIGDRSYSDSIYAAACQLENSNTDLAVEHVSPKSQEALEESIRDWFEIDTTMAHPRRLLVLTSVNNYDQILRSHPEWQCHGDDAVLLLDMQPLQAPDTPNFYSRYIKIYGAAFEAGYMAYLLGCKKPVIIFPNYSQFPLNVVDDGFLHGYQDFDGTEMDLTLYYLADDSSYSNYEDAESLYHWCYDNDGKYDFIMPLCGGSSYGAYRYSRERSVYTIGIDGDMQDYSKNIIASIVKRSNLLLIDFVTQWMNHEEQPQVEIYGLESDYEKLIVSKNLKTLIPGIDSQIKQIHHAAIEYEYDYDY